MNTNKRILILASFAPSLYHFRGDYIEDLIANNFDVYAGAPEMDSETAEKLKSYGAKPVEINLQRTGMNPLKDIKAIFSIRKIIKEHKIDILFPYTIKPVIYGSIAARSLKIPTFSLITGLGYTFSATSFKSKVLQHFSQILYRIALKKNKVVIFQNKDDHQLFIDNNVMTKNQNFDIVSGSGVNLNKYKFRVKKNNGEKIIFVFVARLIREKGINLFIDAANVLKERYPHAEFHVFGETMISPSAIDIKELMECHETGVIYYHGDKNNIQDYLYNSDVFVLPTFYREGIPRSILECLSVGMPLITTDSPGCRETVIQQENGVLIKPQNLQFLIDAMEFFLKNPAKIETMGVKSREYAEKRFDVKIINKNLISIIKSQTT
jgi:glycosyltransferase involved in cell wall biosynthesis